MAAIISADKLYSLRYTSERNVGETATRTIGGLNFQSPGAALNGGINVLIEVLRLFSVGTLINFKLVQEQVVTQE